MFDEKKKALEISAEIEHLIAINRVPATTIADYIGTTSVAFSLNRSKLRRGKLVSSKFIFGVRDFFLNHNDGKTE